jgi:hypothetical protein
VPDRQPAVQVAPVQPAAPTQGVVAPPRTGDGGLLDDGSSPVMELAGLALLLSLGLMTGGALLYRRPQR